MIDVIQKLLELQTYDRKIQEIEELLNGIDPQKEALNRRLAAARAELEQARAALKQAESDRKQIELEIDAKKQLIQKYSFQQYQTKKNEEYRALANEIETCKQAISALEDQELELLYRIDELTKAVRTAETALQRTAEDVARQLAGLEATEQQLLTEIAALRETRANMCQGIDESALKHYEHMVGHRGAGRIVVGIDRGICGGCHVQLPRQYLVRCRTGKELVLCPNCDRILYYSPEMNLVPGE